jgi:hypothetical protein
MDVSAIFKQQQAWIDKMGDALAGKMKPIDASQLPLDVKKERIAELTEKVKRLAARKEELLRNYDRAIDEGQKAIDYLRSEVKRDETVRAGGGPKKPSSSGRGRKPNP